MSKSTKQQGRGQQRTFQQKAEASIAATLAQLRHKQEQVQLIRSGAEQQMAFAEQQLRIWLNEIGGRYEIEFFNRDESFGRNLFGSYSVSAKVHFGYEILKLAPASPQEFLTLQIRGGNLIMLNEETMKWSSIESWELDSLDNYQTSRVLGKGHKRTCSNVQQLEEFMLACISCHKLDRAMKDQEKAQGLWEWEGPTKQEEV